MTTPPTVDGGPRNQARLYAVYLGGNLAQGRMGEDHEVIHVVAPDVPEARRIAKRKWRGSGAAHVDAVLHIDVVDGFAVVLEPGARTGNSVVDNTFDPE
jgi:hypothetical protein